MQKIDLASLLSPWNAAIVLRSSALQTVIAQQLPDIAQEIKNTDPYMLTLALSLAGEISYKEGPTGSFDFTSHFYVQREGGGTGIADPEYTYFISGNVKLHCDVTVDANLAKFHVTKVDVTDYHGDLHYKATGVEVVLDKVPVIRDHLKSGVSDAMGTIDRDIPFDLGRDLVESGASATLAEGVVLYLNFRLPPLRLAAGSQPSRVLNHYCL